LSEGAGTLAGLRVIVTGGAGGIGAAVVRGFAARGAKLAGFYHSKPPADDLAPLAAWFQCDLADKKAVDAAFGEAARALGGLDALIAVAGKWRAAATEEAGDEEIDFAIDANLKSTIYANQAALRLMKPAGSGRIVNFGSVEGVEGNVKSPIYAAAKAGAQNWTRSAARDWGKYGVTVNAVAPIMETPGAEYSRSLRSAAENAALDAALKVKIPIDGKMGDPLRDCVPVLAFLVSDAARFVTGQLISVDGGYRMLGA
jgi:3-oxoacyl-[acyl-carrier protein] reductase